MRLSGVTQAKILPAASVSRRSIPTDIFKIPGLPATIRLVKKTFAARGEPKCILDFCWRPSRR
jgi:hypothetical protein